MVCVYVCVSAGAWVGVKRGRKGVNLKRVLFGEVGIHFQYRVVVLLSNIYRENL